MFLVDEILVSTEVLTQKFVCDLESCKGACCWEGDFGAPLQRDEVDIVSSIMDHILPMLSEEAKDILFQQGIAVDSAILKGKVTPLQKNGACVYLANDENGIARCAFEIAYERGLTDWRKPISCHLYPIRVHQNQETGWEALNYDVWDICSAACTKGKKLRVPLFRFAKEAIIRKYGSEFYDQLEGLYEEFISHQEEN